MITERDRIRLRKEQSSELERLSSIVHETSARLYGPKAQDDRYKQEYLSSDEKKEQEIERLRTHLVQTSEELGVFGVSIRGSEVSVTDVNATINQIIRNGFARNVDAGKSIFDLAASVHGVSVEAVQTARTYYYDHRDAFDVYYRVEPSLRKTDPRLAE